jgi:PAS domain-containing protein
MVTDARQTRCPSDQRFFRWRVARAEARLAIEAAERAHARLGDAIDILPEGVVFLDAENRYILWNPRDRTHYEQFRSFHLSFYRAVEATSARRLRRARLIALSRQRLSPRCASLIRRR